MNNIYVDELPIKVAQRVIHFEDGKLNCVELMFNSSYKPEEIKLLTDRLAEERKKVVMEIARAFNRKIDDEFGDTDVKYITLDIDEVNFYLKDQIERGE